jgi:hypothetical protein
MASESVSVVSMEMYSDAPFLPCHTPFLLAQSLNLRILGICR